MEDTHLQYSIILMMGSTGTKGMLAPYLLKLGLIWEGRKLKSIPSLIQEQRQSLILIQNLITMLMVNLFSELIMQK